MTFRTNLSSAMRGACWSALFSLPLWLTAQSPAQTLAWADSLRARGQHEAAAEAYERVLFFDRGPHRQHCLLQLTECYLALGKAPQALRYLERAALRAGSDSLRRELGLQKVLIFLQLQQPLQARAELLALQGLLPPDEQARFELYLASVSLLAGQYGEADSLFRQLGAAFPEEGRQALEALLRDLRRVGRHNPQTAQWLSVFLPGAGQIYAGDLKNGLNSFLLTGALAAFTLYLWVEIGALDALLTGLPWASRYYLGGVRRSDDIARARFAERRNEIFQDILTLVARYSPGGIN
jgi:tetratricopeptide (TPR) repeat protein